MYITACRDSSAVTTGQFQQTKHADRITVTLGLFVDLKTFLMPIALLALYNRGVLSKDSNFR